MKMSDSTIAMLSEQVNAEFYAAYLYFSMAIWANGQDLDGMSHWLELQAREELGHGMRLHKYISERAGDTILAPIEKPEAEFESPLAVFEAAYAHELEITDNFKRLTATALEEQDFATVSALQWFVDEQVEEEDSFLYWVEKLRQADGNKAAMLFLDGQMGKREG